MSPLVLIVEDERKIRDLVRRYLERDGLSVLSTGSGAEAIAMAADAHPDLVILDLGLPDVPGEAVAREIRAGSDIPILMLTARADERDRIAGLELGADDYVTKPDNLGRAVLLGSALAVALALVGAALVTRRVVRPLRRLAAAATRLQGGDLEARAADPSAPGELGELSRAFDRMAEALDRQERSRRRLASDLAHEIRTPITILQGNLEELIDGGEIVTTERLASLHEEVLRLSSLVEQLDALARAEAPVAALDLTSVDLGALAATQLDALGTQIAAKKLTVQPRLSAVTVRADRARLGQVLANPLGNALKFTPEGGRIEVVVAESDGEARVEVADTGPGIPPADHARVFERFWRGPAAAGVSGRGVGLAVVDEIVHAHGGRVEVTDNDGSGARFIVALPAA